MPGPSWISFPTRVGERGSPGDALERSASEPQRKRWCGDRTLSSIGRAEPSGESYAHRLDREVDRQPHSSQEDIAMTSAVLVLALGLSGQSPQGVYPAAQGTRQGSSRSPSARQGFARRLRLLAKVSPAPQAPSKVAPAPYAPSKVSPTPQAPSKIAPAPYAPGKVSPAPQAPSKIAPAPYAPARFRRPRRPRARLLRRLMLRPRSRRHRRPRARSLRRLMPRPRFRRPRRPRARSLRRLMLRARFRRRRRPRARSLRRPMPRPRSRRPRRPRARSPRRPMPLARSRRPRRLPRKVCAGGPGSRQGRAGPAGSRQGGTLRPVRCSAGPDQGLRAVLIASAIRSTGFAANLRHDRITFTIARDRPSGGSLLPETCRRGRFECQADARRALSQRINPAPPWPSSHAGTE